MVVQEYMTQKVFTLCADKRLVVAHNLMSWAHIRHIPVIDSEQRVIGIVSHRDLLRAAISSTRREIAGAVQDQHLAGIRIEEVMSTDLSIIGPDASVQKAAQMLRTSRIGCLPVVWREKLIGIVTEHDLLGIVERIA